MKTEEDEAFDELAKRQGAWGGGFPAKRAATADKLQEPVQEPASYLHAVLKAFGPDEGISLDKKAWSQFHAAIQTVLAQPAQEPVKCAVRDCQNHMHQGQFVGSVCLPCYITPPQREWVGLTDDEVMEMMGYDKQYGHIPQYARNFVEAISAKLKEKNND